MRNKTIIHFYCEVCWLPGTRDKPLYSPKKEFFHLSQFTSDFSQTFDVVVYFDENPLEGEPTCNKAQLVFPYGLRTKDFHTLMKLAKNAELVLIDGNTIKAICRNLEFVGDQNLIFGGAFTS